MNHKQWKCFINDNSFKLSVIIQNKLNRGTRKKINKEQNKPESRQTIKRCSKETCEIVFCWINPAMSLKRLTMLKRMFFIIGWQNLINSTHLLSYCCFWHVQSDPAFGRFLSCFLNTFTFIWKIYSPSPIPRDFPSNLFNENIVFSKVGTDMWC